MWKQLAAISLVVALAPVTDVSAFLFTYGICQTGCNALAAACYTAGGAVFGTVTVGAGTPAVIAGCSAAQGTCMAACVAAGLLPTP